MHYHACMNVIGWERIEHEDEYVEGKKHMRIAYMDGEERIGVGKSGGRTHGQGQAWQEPFECWQAC